MDFTASPAADFARRPLHAAIAPLAAALLFAALVTDIAYLKTVTVQWENFSVWLLTGGLLLTLVTAILLLFDLIAQRGVARVAWAPFLAGVVAALLSLVNVFVHSRDAYTAVAPSGVLLSAVVAVLLAVMGWNGWAMTTSARVAASR